MIYFTLEKVLEEKQLSKYWLSKQTGIDNNTLGKICNNESKQIKLETLDKICSALNIMPNDILKLDKQINLFDYWEENNSNNIITNDESLKTREQNNINVINEEPFNYEIQQARLNLEYEIETNINEIIDNIIADADNSIYHDDFKEEIQSYFKAKEIPLSFKLSQVSMYRLIYTILSSRYDNELLAFLTSIRNIYANGGLTNLNDNELTNLVNTTYKFINTINCPIELKIKEKSKQSVNILNKIDIHNKIHKKD